MSTQSKGTYQITGWDEKPYSQEKGQATLAKARVTNTFDGDIQGEGVAEYLLVYPKGEGDASFIGLQEVNGTVNGRKGSFVLAIDGTFANGQAKGDWTVVDGSAKGELEGLKGKGGFVSTSGGAVELHLGWTIV
ncbi:hypothetical protein GCM10009677_16040 [Sphaerisporangium rubeum]|uniref:DUF3224 domain-containing protein n=1 Tax=Sphaerisporangium rubeum TaxID=321317 RepID=A0A7X0IJ81_9ACTN|nr:DUF3224 domain-containing protein [Sphaerisporangium rubeum]MBB6475689.1 hypothetical protein [Sphaerisporangium rubeum]